MSRIVRLVLILALLPVAGWASTPRPPAAAIASAHPLATEAGHEVLAAGGNAFDAAVAITAVLGVVEPMGSGLGGGGFWLLHRATDGFEVMVDGRERAPLAATRDMYLDKDGQPVLGLSLDGPLAAGIPGIPAALDHISRKYGRLPLKQSLATAIRYARQGFSVSKRYRRFAAFRRATLLASPAAAKLFLDQGNVPQKGYVVRQRDLARTLKRFARKGRAGFYQGVVARRLVRGVRSAGGIWTKADLEAYRIVERAPILARYRGVRIASAALPSSGGIVLAQMLNILRELPLAGRRGAARTHLIIEVMRRAYRDRARYLGDPDFITVNTGRLLDARYAQELAQGIGPGATPSDALPGLVMREHGRDTTHFSVIDRAGNRVAATLSINYPFGSGFIPPDTGVLLNNEMDDFAIKPGVPNVYGLVGADANSIAPGKRPLSSMTPTFLETEDAVVVLGTPGGSRIITMVLLATLEFAGSHGRAQDWVALPRFHHQYLPDVVVHEPGAFDEAEIRALERRGHTLKPRSLFGNMQIVLWNKKQKRMEAASDPRGEGLALVR